MAQTHAADLENSALGKKTSYESSYNPDKLYDIPRNAPRQALVYGYDIWNHYEVSWLNAKGKPVVSCAQIIFTCNSPNIIESKSMKLYFHSLNNTKFENVEAVSSTVTKDLEQKLGAPVGVKFFPVDGANLHSANLDGISLDELDVDCDTYTIDTSFLKVENEVVAEKLYSHLLRSNCLITHQPDWGSVQIAYRGNKINHEGLLRYIVSYRDHNEFGEHCIERMFMDIKTHCKPQELLIYMEYTRRGGIDINFYRSTQKLVFDSHARFYRL